MAYVRGTTTSEANNTANGVSADTTAKRTSRRDVIAEELEKEKAAIKALTDEQETTKANTTETVTPRTDTDNFTDSPKETMPPTGTENSGNTVTEDDVISFLKSAGYNVSYGNANDTGSSATVTNNSTVSAPTIQADEYTSAYNGQINYSNELNSDLYGRINDDVDTYTTNWESFYAFLTSDPTQNAGYQSIRDSYSARGDVAAGAAVADGSAANAGNVDSYAAANARRQELAYETAGSEAALGYWNSLLSQYGGALTSQADATNTARSTQSGLVGNAYDAASELGAYDYNSRVGTAETTKTNSGSVVDAYAEAFTALGEYAENNPNSLSSVQVQSVLRDLKQKYPSSAYEFDTIWQQFNSGEYDSVTEFLTYLYSQLDTDTVY